MAPSSINDSARAMMARLAEFRDDTSGLLATGGTSTAYTITTFQGLATIPNDGQLIAFSPHAVNGIAPTLQADGGTTYPIQSSPGVAVAAASLVTGSPYTAKFSLSNAAWILFGFYSNPFNIPLASAMPYFGTTAPNSNFVLPFGQAISRTTYAPLFALTGTTYGAGDGVNTFNLPDLRGRVPAGKDDMGGAGANRLTSSYFGTGTVLGTAGGSEDTALTSTNQFPPYTPTGSIATTVTTAAGKSTGFSGGGATEALVANGSGNQGNNLSNVLTASAVSTFTGTNVGLSTPFRTVQPTLIANYIMRIL